jgi:hypothetical protein
MTIILLRDSVLPNSFINKNTSSRWHSISERVGGIFRDEKSFEDDDKWMVVTPMSQPDMFRPVFPPNARPSI